MKALILAAGYGTRLYPLTIGMPKALLEIGKKRLIDFLVEKVHEAKIEDITVVTNDRFYYDFLEWSRKYPFNISILNDQTKSPEERLGAVGDVEFVLKNESIDDDVLVLGGDNLFSWDLRDFCAFASKLKKPLVGLYDVGHIEKAKRFGVVAIDQEGKITYCEEKPSCPTTTLVGTCIYYFPKAFLSLMDKYSAANPDKDTIGQYIVWLSEETSVYGYVFKGDWLDIGHKDALEEAKDKFTDRGEQT